MALHRSFVFWLPAIIRLILYAAVTMVSAFMIQSDKFKTADSLGWGWIEYSRFWAPILAAGAGTIVAFLDQTMAGLRKERETAMFQRTT